MSENIQVTGIKYINDFLKTWTNKYLYQTIYQDYTALGHTFVTEFSLPIKQKPVPVATVKVYFYLIPNEGEEIDMKFRFENDSLIHKPDRTLRISKMEKWLEKFLDKKAQTSKVLFLGTEFESTRIKHEILDKIYDEMNYKEEFKEEKYLSEDLLEQPNELQLDEEYCDEQNQIETMKTSLFEVFRSVDKDDMGVLSLNECKEVFQLMGLQLTQLEWDQLLKMADQDKNGLIVYQEFIDLGAEMIHAIFMKNNANKHLIAREEEFLLQSILILHGSEIHETVGIVMEEIIKLDEDEEGFVPIIPELKQILNKHNEVLNPSEIEEIIKSIQRTYEDNKFPYKELYTVLLDYKVYNLKNGLMESSLNKLEIYLRSICEPYDKDKKSLIHIDDLMTALKQSDKIILSKNQTYIIRSFMDKDENDCVNYIIGSRILSAMIKKFFTPSLLEKKAKLIQQGLIKEDEYMKGWSQEEINSELRDIDKQGKDCIDFDQVRHLVKNSKLSITEDELQATFRHASIEEEGHVTVNEFVENFYGILKGLRCQLAIAQLADI